MGELKSYKELIVWQKSIELARNLYLLTKSFPEDEKFGLTSQIRRASYSVPSNIAEGWGRNSSGNFIQFLKIANGSLCELETQLTLVQVLEIKSESELSQIMKLIEENCKMLRSLISKIEKQKQGILKN